MQRKFQVFHLAARRCRVADVLLDVPPTEVRLDVTDCAVPEVTLAHVPSDCIPPEVVVTLAGTADCPRPPEVVVVTFDCFPEEEVGVPLANVLGCTVLEVTLANALSDCNPPPEEEAVVVVMAVMLAIGSSDCFPPEEVPLAGVSAGTVPEVRFADGSSDCSSPMAEVVLPTPPSPD